MNKETSKNEVDTSNCVKLSNNKSGGNWYAVPLKDYNKMRKGQDICVNCLSPQSFFKFKLSADHNHGDTFHHDTYHNGLLCSRCDRLLTTLTKFIPKKSN